MPLRYYQEDAKDAIMFAWEEYDRVLLHLGTGGGKTVIAAYLIAELLPARCLFLADQDELCLQPQQVFTREVEIVPALEKAKHRASLAAKVVVGSSQTMCRTSRLERYPRDFFKYIIVDEAHRGTDRDMKILEYFNEAKVCGITATPYRAKLLDLSKYYTHVAYSMPMMDLINEGFAPPLKVKTIPIEIDLGDVRKKTSFGEKDFDLESLETTIAPYYIKIIEHLAEHKHRKMLVRLPLVRASKVFTEMAKDAGIKAVHVDGTSEDRVEIIEGFKHGQFDMLCNANLIEVGVDIPIADCFINLAPTWSAAKYNQAVGRVMRVQPGLIDDIPDRDKAQDRIERIALSDKPDAMVIDFMWQHDRLTQNAANLIGKNEEEVAMIKDALRKDHTEQELQEIAMRVLAEREAAIVKAIEKARDKMVYREVVFEPKVMGLLLNSQAIMDYEPSRAWENDPASPAQVARLKSWGLKTDGVTKGLAHVIGGVMHFRFRFHFASLGQLLELQRLGVTVDPNKLTSRQANDLITQAKLHPREEPEIPFE